MKTWRRLLPFFVTSVALLFGLAGCASDSGSVSSSAIATDASPSSSASDTASASVEGSYDVSLDAPNITNESASAAALAALAKFNAALTPLQGSKLPDSDSIAHALLKAGFSKDSIAVSATRTPTDLTPDGMWVGVKLSDTECLLGQFPKSSSFVSAVARPVNGVCLIGDTDTIDW